MTSLPKSRLIQSVALAVGSAIFGMIVHHNYPILSHFVKQSDGVVTHSFDDSSTIGAKGKVLTKFVMEDGSPGQGKMLTMLRLENFPDSFMRPSNQSEALRFVLKDKHGFNVLEIDFPIGSITRNFDPKGGFAGGTAESRPFYISLNDYRRIQDLESIASYRLMKDRMGSESRYEPLANKGSERVVCHLALVDDRWVSGIPKNSTGYIQINTPEDGVAWVLTQKVESDAAAVRKKFEESEDEMLSICPRLKIRPVSGK